MTAGFLESLLAKTHPFPKTRWLYLVAPRCRSVTALSRFTERRAWCHDVLYFAYRRRMPISRSTQQQHFRNANAMVFCGDDEDGDGDSDGDLRPGDRLCPGGLIDIPSTHYASSFPFFSRHRSIMWGGGLRSFNFRLKHTPFISCSFVNSIAP